MRVSGGEPVRATDEPARHDMMASEPWVAVRSELDRLVGQVDERIDPAIRVIEAVVAGFHGIDSDADPEMAELFAAGARDRKRILTLEQELGKVRRALEDLTVRTRT
jgi:hypothetical protein